jgi:hypothetical protein
MSATDTELKSAIAALDALAASPRLVRGDFPGVREEALELLGRTMLANKADELDLTIRKLTAMRDGLRHAAACRAHGTWNARPSGGCSRWLAASLEIRTPWPGLPCA